MKADVTFYGKDTFAISVESEDARFGVSNVSLETLKQLKERLDYVIERAEENENEERVKEKICDYIWNPKSKRHEKVEK